MVENGKVVKFHPYLYDYGMTMEGRPFVVVDKLGYNLEKMVAAGKVAHCTNHSAFILSKKVWLYFI